jgi:hypothetical protein
MMSIARAVRMLVFLIVSGIAFAGEGYLAAQQATQTTTPEGYIPRGTRPGKGLAPGMRVTDLGKCARTYRVNMTKGDEIMSGLTEFAVKYKIRNARFTGLGAI